MNLRCTISSLRECRSSHPEPKNHNSRHEMASPERLSKQTFTPGVDEFRSEVYQGCPLNVAAERCVPPVVEATELVQQHSESRR